MKANELRIGNLFKVEKTKAVYKVVSLNTAAINNFLTDDYVSGFDNLGVRGQFEISQLKPIKITAKRLKQLGFEKDNVGYFEIPISDSVFLCYCNGRTVLYQDEDFIELKNIKYLHQMQNLYFSLSGIELKFKKI